MKKYAKFIALAIVVVATTIGVTYAKKFTLSADGYYKKNSTTCVELIAQGASPFDTKGLSDQQATIKGSDGTIYNVYTESTCTTAATFKP